MSELRLEVKIDGVKYPLVTKESKESIEKIAAYVDGKIKDVKSDKLTFDRQLILASLNIADEYFKDKESFRQYYEENKEAIENFPALKDELETFKNEYGTYKTDLEEKKEELKDLKILLQEKDAEILNLTKAENDADKLREKIKALQKQAMDLTKENEILKGKIDD
ncbi:cell division protein ZapA [Anaerococcus degeneri]|uniref:Cell division protein ZapA n=1 Tax=Anaerococcus degeneri TaxID=361500 RepID=A0ABS7YZJ3_9FIRM|nr:cell division protein ZapA [Anaerococcus degeneri]MBP2015428.1 cell division protein ZapA [Anaerococcus degeneri]MCA2095787.1 cell division protein ZapA [Anaerococcus degeneri]